MHTTHLDIRLASSHDIPHADYVHHSSAQRINTDQVMLKAIREQYPHKHVTVTPEYGCDLLGYAAAGHALAMPVADSKEYLSSKWRSYAPPAKWLDGGNGELFDTVFFGKYQYAWKGHDFILYFIDGRDGISAARIRNNYIIGDEAAIDQLVLDVGKYTATLHEEIWVFDQGYWRKDPELWRSISHASWDDIILDAEMKRALLDDVTRFYDSRSTYNNLKVPWKRGLIFYGPPGNGKTISIKATMHTLYQRKEPVPTLYVKTVNGYVPPEYAITRIFQKARQEAPCYLVFEDLDSIVSDRVRSLFLNEVDGISNNDGILMVGSTNHLDRLDPGIAKRPSRFDRKYYFPYPDKEERIKYCEYWQGKLSDSKDIEFPHRMCTAIAEITDGFSFAYIQEAFVAALLVIAGRKDSSAGSGWNERRGIKLWQDSTDDQVDSPAEKEPDNDLDKFVLWREIKLQIKLLRKELEEKKLPLKHRASLWAGFPSQTFPPPPTEQQNDNLDLEQFDRPQPTPYSGIGIPEVAVKGPENAAPFPAARATPNGIVGGIPEPSPDRDVSEYRVTTAESERLGKAQVVRDMQAALEASGDPQQLQNLKRAVEEFLFRSSWKP